jgi:hypothetical protein
MDAADATASIELQGPSYAEFLASLHRELSPRTYLEIGTLHGTTLRLARCPSIAVDPRFQVTDDVIGEKPALHLFQERSDEFFRANDPREVLGAPIDLAFLDGMHLFEFVLRDFINTEPCCHPNSVIAIHDCVPSDPHIAGRSSNDPARQRSRHPKWWTGDVWKIVPALREHRPDLAMHIIDCQPTGLVLITALDPQSRVLAERYDAITEAFVGRTLAEYPFDRYIRECDIRPAAELDDGAKLVRPFRLQGAPC